MTNFLPIPYIINDDIIMFHDKSDGVQYESETYKFSVFIVILIELKVDHFFT